MGRDERKKSVYMPEDMLNDVLWESVRLERSMSWVIQTAWAIARENVKKFPSAKLSTSDRLEANKRAAARKNAEQLMKDAKDPTLSPVPPLDSLPTEEQLIFSKEWFQKKIREEKENPPTWGDDVAPGVIIPRQPCQLCSKPSQWRVHSVDEKVHSNLCHEHFHALASHFEITAERTD